MCGIAGIVSYVNDIREKKIALENMRDSLKRRGPDQDGLYITPSAGLAHTRLSVIDIENGRQPMSVRRGNQRLDIVYNGELYNAAELKNELKLLGHNFISESDTEILLHAFARWRQDCLLKLNGIFAFAVWDESDKSLFLARDPIGVKPLYFSCQNGNFYFASEIKALFACGEIEAKIDENGIMELVMLGPGRTQGQGVFVGIEELKPGHFAVLSPGGFISKSYWSLKDEPFGDSFDECVEKTRFLVSDAIKRQLVSDVPIGTFLSGGLDSSLISSIAAAELTKRGEQLKTFSVDYPDNDLYFKSSSFLPESDNAYIKRMVDYLGSDHRQVLIETDDLVNALFEAVDARDLPGMADVDSSLLLFCRSVKEDVTVALSGETADEKGFTGCNPRRLQKGEKTASGQAFLDMGRNARKDASD